MQTFNRLVTTDAKIAQTPKEVIWTLNKAKLYRYVPVVPEDKRRKLPLLLVFAIMNRPHVLDLRPGHSFVEYMLQRGYDVYLLDWGAPGPEDKQPQVRRLHAGVPAARHPQVQVGLRLRGVQHAGLVPGALISTLYAALRPDDGLKNLVLLTAPLDFTDKTAGGFARWTSDKAFNADKIVDTFGNVPGEMIDYGAKALKPVENFIGSYLNLWDNIDNPKVVEAWHAMNTWVRDIIPMAGGAYRQLVNDFYKENRLMEGTLVLRGERVDLSKLKANVLNVIAEARPHHAAVPVGGGHGPDRQPGQGGVPRAAAGTSASWPAAAPRRTPGRTSRAGWRPGRADGGAKPCWTGFPHRREPPWRRSSPTSTPASGGRSAALLPLPGGSPGAAGGHPGRPGLASCRPRASAERLAVLARGCPTLHKLGQVLARDRRLSAELRQYLQGLESLPPAVPLETIQGILAQELGPLDRLGVTLLPPALAEASVAVVIPFRDRRSLSPGTASSRSSNPEVVERLEEELELFERVGSYLDERCEDFGIPHLDYRESFEQVRDKLHHEVRFDREQRHLALARAAYKDEPRVHVPALFDHCCTPRVTAMERVTGGKVTERRPGHRGREAAGWRTSWARRWSPGRSSRRASQALFHGDPHAGEPVPHRGRPTGHPRLEPGRHAERASTRRADADYARRADSRRRADRDQPRRSSPSGGVDRPALESVVHAWLGRIMRGQFPGFTWLSRPARRGGSVRRGCASGPTCCSSARRSTPSRGWSPTSCGKESEVNFDRILLGEFLVHLAAEWPQRWLVPPDSRAFATRLSNVDLTSLLLGLPWAATRFWLGQLQPATRR